MPVQWIPAVERAAIDDGQVLVGLLGQGIAGSRTPRMHMTEGHAQGLRYDYRLIDLADCDPRPALDEILSQVEAAGFRGLNVTFPYKQAVIPHLDTLSEDAQAVGAVNTIVFRDGKRFGHNTDYWGFAENFRLGLPDVRRNATLLLGAGGAGGAVAAALLGARVGSLLIRDPDIAAAQRLARALCDRFGRDRAKVATDLASAAAIADGIVNTSPVGMEKLPGLPIPADLIEPRHWVADIVYFPLETELLATARALGCRVLPGTGMAIHQAVRAFELFTGLKADPARMQVTFDSFEASNS
ncbi:MAG: shikimate dehydrogenase [Jannaschia sp.]